MYILYICVFWKNGGSGPNEIKKKSTASIEWSKIVKELVTPSITEWQSLKL